MDTFTRLSECILCQFKFVFMAISIYFEHQEYRSVIQIFFKWVFMVLLLLFDDTWSQ